MKIAELKQIIEGLKERVKTDQSWSDLLFFYERLLSVTLEKITSDAFKQEAFNEAKKACSICEGSGEVYHNGSYYGCSHGLSYEDRKLSTGIVL